MPTLEAIGQELHSIKQEYAQFLEGPLQTYQQEYSTALREVINAYQYQRPAIQKLIFHALQQKSHIKNVTSFEQLINTPAQKLEIELDLIDLFRAGYSTNVDLEIESDITQLQTSPIVDVHIKDPKPLFHQDIVDEKKIVKRQKNGDPIINPSLGTLIIETKKEFLKKNVPHKPMFPRKIEIISSNTMMPSEMNQLDMYAESDRLSDQLAYHFYTNTKHDVEKFVRLGDHQRYAGINGLSVAIYQLLENYIYTDKDTFEQSIYSPYQSIIDTIPIIPEFNQIFDGYLELDITSKHGLLIYKLGPKLKQ